MNSPSLPKRKKECTSLIAKKILWTSNVNDFYDCKGVLHFMFCLSRILMNLDLQFLLKYILSYLKYSYNYTEPRRLVMVRTECSFCNKYCKDGICFNYIVRACHLGYQYCENCKLNALWCAKKYCKLNKIIPLTFIFDNKNISNPEDKTELVKFIENKIKIPRKKKNPEDWYIDCENINFNSNTNQWYLFLRNPGFSLYKSVYIDAIKKLNPYNKNIIKIENYIKTNF